MKKTLINAQSTSRPNWRQLLHEVLDRKCRTCARNITTLEVLPNTEFEYFGHVFKGKKIYHDAKCIADKFRDQYKVEKNEE